MDVNFSNVLEGTRQYFQGLPKASPNSAQSQNESPTAAAVRPFWSEGPSGPSAALPAQPARFRGEEGSLAQSGSPTMADSRPPSVAAAHPSPAPPQGPLPYRPPSEPLLEPEVHIIHKATVMQQAQAQAQQKQQSYLNPSRDLERPPSINMISPPTHIIHKPQRAPSEQTQRAEAERQDGRASKEEPRIPPHFAVTEGGRYPPESIVPQDPSPVHPSKYYSHLPTPPPPSSYPNRTQTGSQQRTLTVLQARHSYQSATYSKETLASSNGKIPQKSPYISSSQPSEMYARQQYETVTVSGSSPADVGRGSSAPDPYLNSTQMTSMAIQSSHKTHRTAPVQYSRSQSYRPPQNHPDRPPPPEREKSAGTLTSVRHYPQTVPHQKSRAVPVPKPSTAQTSQAQSGQHPYVQRAVPQPMHNSYSSVPRDPVLYASQQNHARVPDPSISDGSPSRLSSGTSSHDYNYARRLPPKSASNHVPAGPTPNYHDRVPVHNADQRHTSLTPLASQTHSSRSASHPNMIGDSSHHYPRVPAAPSQHPGLKREYHPSPPLKSHPPTTGHHYVTSGTSHRQYSTVNPGDHSTSSGPSGSASAGSSGYQTQVQYRQAPALKHSYEPSPKHGAPPRTFPSKSNLAAHQPRPTVSVTSLVTQMNVMRQQTTRPESAGAPIPKHRKESPLDLSVKTVRIPADSTAQDDPENMVYEKREAALHRGNIVNANVARDPSTVPTNMINQRHRYPTEPEPVNSHKVDFLPNFNTQHQNKSLPRPYAESVQPYLQNATAARYERGYPEAHPGAPPSSYHNRVPPHPEVQQGYADRYENAPKQTYATAADYGRRVEQSLPKIDLTINLDDYERDRRRNTQAMRDESRKREAGRIPTTIPHKSSRYESWNVDRHGRPEAIHPREVNASAASVHYKTVNGTDLAAIDRRKHYENHVYAKKSENVEPLPPKYYPGHVQQSHSQPEVFYQKVSNYQHHYDYNPPEKLPQPPPAKQELHAIQHTTPADKRVLSILRNSLEARNYSDSQKATDSSDDCIVVPSDSDTVPSGDFSEYQSKKTKHMIEHRSSMASLSNESTSNTVSYKVQIPRAVDSIKYDSDSSLKSIRIRDDLQCKPAISGAKEITEVTPGANEPPNESTSPTDMDIAAVLAARIRTKAELKGFTQSSSNTCPIKPKVFENNTEVKESEAPLNVSKTVPPITHRRRLFSKTESDSSAVNETRKEPPTIRNSSDSCIFDFPDSGSESEKPVSDKVPIEIVSKENQSDAANVDKTLLLVKSEEKSVPEEDPIWAEACDSFLEQLKTGKMKKAKRKNALLINKEKPEPLLKDNLIDTIKVEKSVIVNVVDIVKSDRTNLFIKKIKQEVNEPEADSPVPSDSSDEDQPLINRKVKKEKEDKLKTAQQVPSDIDFNWKSAVIKIENTMDISDISKKSTTSKSNCLLSESKHQTDKCSSDDERLIIKKRKQEILKSEITHSDSSDTDSDEIVVATRSKTRKSVSLKGGDSKLMKSPTKESLKNLKDDGSKLKKQVFGDGSDFRPGWEEEVYKFKQSLRMPPRLINVTRPPHWPRVSTSLPDLDPYPNSPAPSTSTEELYTKKYSLNTFDGHEKSKHDMDSDSESMSSYSINHKPNYDSEASCSTVMSTTDKVVKNKAKQDNNSSIIDLLIQKCGKKDIRKKKNKDDSSIPKMIPKSTNPSELLATPSLSLERDPLKKGIKGVMKGKVTEERSYLGSFRKQTISTFRAAFISNTDGLLGATEEFSPVVMKSRTRTETRVLKQRATIKEVFGDERPASAPPVSCREEEEEEEPTPVVQIKMADIKNKIILKKKMKKSLNVAREGLRSSRLKRSDAKGRLLRIKKRNNFLKSLSSKKLKNSTAIIHKVKKEGTDGSPIITEKDSEGIPVPVKKRFRKLFTRRKFSSGFDYIRKKKKLIKKEDGHKRKRGILSRPSPESVHDIQREIKNWIINKSVGETVLHRAARLGFTDCVAYCLEKLDVPPSCRDNAGYTALHEACSRGHLDIAKLLLQYGANVSEAAQGGIRPLHEACENGFIEIIRLLLSYGADPLLATYSGQTPISLSGGKAARLLQLHLNDVQGNVPQPWHFYGPCKLLDPADSGYDAVGHPPSAPPLPAPQHQIELISASTPLPPLYRLKPAPHTSTSNSDSERSNSSSDSGLWCLLQDLAALLQVKSRDALLKQIHCGPGPPRDSLKELRMQEFLDRAQCQQLMSAGEKINIRASKIALVRYTEKVKQLLNTETVVVR